MEFYLRGQRINTAICQHICLFHNTITTMVKIFKKELRKEEFVLHDKIRQSIQQLQKLRRRDLILDTRKNCIKRGVEYSRPKLNINEYLTSTAQDKMGQKFDETQKEVHCYRVALQNTKEVLRQLEEMEVKNERPADYLVEMFKSDKQMFKVRRHLTEKEEDIKQKMQGKDWASKNKRKERAKKKAEAKREKKKGKMAAKGRLNAGGKPKMVKQNGKNKVKKIRK